MAEESNQESKNNSSNVLLELFQKIEAGNSKILEKFQEFSENHSNLTSQIATMKKLGEVINIDIAQTYQINKSSFIKELEGSLDKTKNITLSLSERDDKRMNKMENLFTRFWKVPIWIGTICTLMAGITIFFAIKYYGESVKSKEELKEDIAKEMQSKNLIWIEKGEFNKLNENMKIIKLWSEENPDDSKSLEDFIKGYETFKKEKK